nr:MerR family transcriptional regulator [Lactobacillus sp. S2-2]
MANATGLPQSKLRYWEQKGYISSIQNGKNQNKQYSYHTMIMVELIKSFMDSGYTLSASVNKAKKHNKTGSILKKMLFQMIKKISMIDNKTCINMGQFEGIPNKDIIFVYSNGKTKIKLMDTKKDTE